eukprot:1354761-Rhodomonas_salina.1
MRKAYPGIWSCSSKPRVGDAAGGTQELVKENERFRKKFAAMLCGQAERNPLGLCSCNQGTRGSSARIWAKASVDTLGERSQLNGEQQIPTRTICGRIGK